MDVVQPVVSVYNSQNGTASKDIIDGDCGTQAIMSQVQSDCGTVVLNPTNPTAFDPIAPNDRSTDPEPKKDEECHSLSDAGEDCTDSVQERLVLVQHHVNGDDDVTTIVNTSVPIVRVHHTTDDNNPSSLSDEESPSCIGDASTDPSQEHQRQQSVSEDKNDTSIQNQRTSIDSNAKETDLQETPSTTTTTTTTTTTSVCAALGESSVLKENEPELENEDCGKLDPIVDQAGSKPPDGSASQASSKFSFFRSISNILIASKWSKLRNISSKSSKAQEDTLSVDDRQRKISQKSLPGDYRKKSSCDERENKSPRKGAKMSREGLEQLETSSASIEKSHSFTKGHFAFFKRLSDTSPPTAPSPPPPVPAPPPPPPPPPPAELTEAQKSLLRSSWAEIGGNIGQVGVIAFIGLFETHPDVKDSFDQFRGMSLDSVFSSISLKEHALRVMTTVEKFVNRIDRTDKLQKILEDLGKRHMAYRFKSDYIKIVGMQFISAMRPHVSQWTPETEAAWTALVDVMTYHMTNGTRMAEEAAVSTC